ncbi:hypothetical protein DL98DRAFT_511810 [Cadophora sp. DSE1049]|nr:hypothetical protein DL98DRAFT_511810 [Cadophora sp. DSE1049]
MEKVDLPPQPQPPPAAVPGQYLPPGPNFQNQLPPPNVPGYVRPPPGSSGIQPPPLDSSQPISNVTPQRKTCNLCLDHLDLSPSNFPFKCPQCNLSQYCSACLKSWFLDACKNESKMPPKCCSIIPLSAVKKLMTVEEMALYKAKLEEWMTPGKLYCPVPTCSTFIPPRLYQKPAKKGFVQIDHSTVDDRNPVTADSQTQPSTDVKVGVACPKCSVQICTDCRSFTHNGHCREDLDPALAEQLKKWKIKRCPRCRTGVRKVYGCSHIECRCGAHFCWQCMQPADQCEGSCDDDQQDDSGVESDDVDGLAGYYDGDGHEFGPEPENEYTIGWNCQHRLAVPGYAVPEGAECHRCFRNIVRDAPEATQDATAEVEENGGERDTQLAWQCFRCSMIFCQDCREEIESR